MGYQNLMEEMNELASQNEASLLSISKLGSFMRNVHSSIQTALNSLISKMNNKISKLNKQSILTANIDLLIDHSTKNANKANQLLESFKISIIDTLTLLYDSQSLTFKETKKKFYNLVNDIFKCKQSLENARLRYYNAAHLSRIKKTGLNLREKLAETIFERIYYYEYNTCNKKLQEGNEIYAKIIHYQKQNEEIKIKMIQSIMAEYVKCIDEFKQLLNDLMTYYTELFSSAICDNERELIKRRLSKYVDTGDGTYSSRFELEKFIGYSEYYNQDLKEGNFPSSFEDCSLSPPGGTENCSNEIIDKIQCKLYSKEEVDPELLTTLLKHLRSRPNEIGKLFLESFGERQWYVCYNYNNLLALMTIFLYISYHFNNETFEDNSLKGIQNINQYQELIEVNKINRRIISLAQKIYIQYNNEIQDKVYLSALMHKRNRVYQNESFWKQTLIISLAEMVYNQYTLVVKNKSKEEKEMEYLRTKRKISDKGVSNNLMTKMSMKVKTSNSTLKRILNESNISIYLPQYDKLSKPEIFALEEYLASEVKKDGFLKEYLMDLSSFSFPIEKIIQLLTDLCKELNLSTEYFSFYISFSNVCSYTIRKRIPNEKYYLDYITVSNISGQERKAKLISCGLKYLEWKDYYNLMGLSKYLHRHISKKIYKLILSNPKIQLNTRLKIWDAILNIKDLRKKHNYESLLQKVSLSLDLKTRKEIEVDIPRTYISPLLNKNEARDSLENILIALAQVNEDTKYCQGMNYIAQFLLEITNNEERAFFIFLGICKSTDYSRIFSKDPSEYKVFFYIFNRLLMLYEPEISYVLAKNSIDVYYFLAPCFYTLFQNTREHIKEPGTPMVLLKILDGCLTSGWKALMKVGLNLLHLNTTKILHMNIEDLIDFITQKIFTIDFFENSHLNAFEQFQAIKLPKNQLNYIDQEYSHELKLQKKMKEC